MTRKNTLLERFGPKLPDWYARTMLAVIVTVCLTASASATGAGAGTGAAGTTDLWTAAQTIIVDIYTHIATLSTALAGLMSAVAVLGAKLSNNQHKVDQAWDWLKRIWVCWAIINGIGAFIAYITPHFSGLATITP